MRAGALLRLRGGLLLLGALACARSGPVDIEQQQPPPQQLVVFAAASLREPFTALAVDFERENPGTTVAFHFAGTQELRTQLLHGAAADIVAAADDAPMLELERAGRVAAPVRFARNQPVLVVSTEAASSIRALSDLPTAKRIVLGAAEVPIGRYSLEILDRAAATLGADFRARVLARVVSRELNVKQVLAKVRMGEADAGIVYRSDAHGLTDVAVVEISPDLNVVADYPVATLVDTARPALARAWQELLLSQAGQSALQRAGFLPRQGS